VLLRRDAGDGQGEKVREAGSYKGPIPILTERLRHISAGKLEAPAQARI
jgi:hypothetical protein